LFRLTTFDPNRTCNYKNPIRVEWKNKKFLSPTSLTLSLSLARSIHLSHPLTFNPLGWGVEHTLGSTPNPTTLYLVTTKATPLREERKPIMQ
jgi:hypothetical protein